MAPVPYASRRGRLVLLATVLGSGAAFLDATVVTVALPRLGDDLGAGFSTLQWVLDGYLLALGSLVLVGGALADALGRRRVLLVGLGGFLVASLACGLAPGGGTLVAARVVQGAFAALLTPASLAVLATTFGPDERGRAIGAWSGLSGVTTAVGPFVGGWLVDTASWRWVFLLNVPVLLVAVAVTRAAVPADRGALAGLPLRRVLGAVDLPGAALTVLGLGLLVGPLIEAARLPGWAVAVGALAGLAVLAGFVAYERRAPRPMLPPGLFAIRTFAAANAVTFAVYAALAAASFLLTLVLQRALGWSALAAGASLVPITGTLLVLSPRVGAVLPRVGPRPLLTAGPVLAAGGLALLSRVGPGDAYVPDVLPGVTLLALGLSLVVAPVTTTVLADVPMQRQGVASGANNAVARVAGLLAVAALPAAAGLASTGVLDPARLVAGYGRAMLAASVLSALGGVVAWWALPARVASPAG